MSNRLLCNYSYKLTFSLNVNALSMDILKWNNLKAVCENGKNKEIVNLIKLKCELENNKSIFYIERNKVVCENTMLKRKEIHFRKNLYHIGRDPKDNDICFNNIRNSNNSYWTKNEIDDIMASFIKVSNEHIGKDCVYGLFKVDYWLNEIE